MSHDLMAEQIEIDPVRVAATFRTSQKFTVKRTCRRQIVYGKGQMKWGKSHRIVSEVNGWLFRWEWRPELENGNAYCCPSSRFDHHGSPTPPSIVMVVPAM